MTKDEAERLIELLVHTRPPGCPLGSDEWKRWAVMMLLAVSPEPVEKVQKVDPKQRCNQRLVSR